MSPRKSQYTEQEIILSAKKNKLYRDILISVFVPPNQHAALLPLLILNDGQDKHQLKLIDTLNFFAQSSIIELPLVVAVHAADRVQEYGVAGKLDFLGRGKLAKQYQQFILQQLLPYLLENYPISGDYKKRCIAGFSMGGLSAIDTAINYPESFGKVGVFSGSLWWRSKAYDKAYTDADRIIHAKVKALPTYLDIDFWFQAGTDDEKADRNNNGIIDSIDDTLDLIKTLQAKKWKTHMIKYIEIKGGKHNFETWSNVFPSFMLWAFAAKN
jgi:enterochelin esterase-like enzyme